jgi:DNA-binding MarR family transcriptional regulator
MVHIPPYIIAHFLSYAALLKLALAKQYGFNALQFLALILVGGTDRLAIKDLKERLSVPGSSLTSTIDSLESKGLMRRRRSKVDRRRWLLSLSAKGQRLYQNILSTESQAVLPALEKLSETERIIFLKLAAEIMQVYPHSHEEEPEEGIRAGKVRK